MTKSLFFIFLSALLLPVVSWSADAAKPSGQPNQQATSQTGALSLNKKQTLKSLPRREIRVLLRKDGVPELGKLQYTKEAIMWVPEKVAAVKLPYKISTLIAANGHSLLQFGDSRNHEHPDKTDLFFLDASGAEKGRVVDRYGPFSNVVMADDGHVAIAGPLFSDAKRTEIGLYSASGETRFQAQLDQGRRANIAVPGLQGKRVVSFTTDVKDYLAKHRLELFDGDGKLVAQHNDLGILQKVIAVANGSMFFVQAKSRFALVDANDGKLLWSKNGVLRLISPHGAFTSPDGQTLFLAAAEWDGIPKERYKWRIEVRDVASGSQLASFILPDTYPSNRGRVFLSATSTQVEVLAGDERIMLDWSRP